MLYLYSPGKAASLPLIFKHMRILLLLPLFFFTAICCSAPERAEDGTCTLGLSIGSNLPGKSYSNCDDGALERWAVFVYSREDKSFVFADSRDAEEEVYCQVKSGLDYDVFAVANYPCFGEHAFSIASVESVEDLLGTVVHLSDASEDCLPMFGNLSTGIVGKDRMLCIPVFRIPSRVEIGKIKIEFEDQRLNDSSLCLSAIYLTNVQCRSTLSGAVAPDDNPESWYNAMQWHGSGENAILDRLVAQTGINTVISNGQSQVLDYCFHTMPNTTPFWADSKSAQWSARCTRLILEATINSKKYYYQITLPEMENGVSYYVKEAVIRKPGSLDPEQDIPGAIDVTLSAAVTGSWNNTYTMSEES